MSARSYSKTQTMATSRTAFTLVELLVVISIITIFAAITLPSVKTLLHGQKITQGARMVQAHIESARSRAIASGSFVAVILERKLSTGAEYNTVLSLSIGNTFPPYEGDTLGATGLLTDSFARNSSGIYATGMDGAYDQLTISAVDGALVTSDVFGVGDFIRIGGRENLFVITDKPTGSGAIRFANPPYYTHTDGTQWPTQEPQLPITGSSTASFKIFRKPTKSLVQATKLPRGTCIDLSVSGLQQSGTQFADLTAPVMIVFDERGSVAFINTGTTISQRPSGVIHLLVGRTEQVAAAGMRQSLADPNDSTAFSANLNDAENRWVSINPTTGEVHTSPVQVGSETAAFAVRLATARSFATNNIVQTAD